MGKASTIRIGQLNLQGSAAATLELHAIVGEHALDIVLLQEPYTRSIATSPGIMLLPTDVSSKAAIYIANTTVACSLQLHLSTSHCVVAHFGLDPPSSSFYAVSAYFQYSHDIGPHLQHLGLVLEALRGRRVIIGVDSNTHSPMWHSLPRHYIGRGCTTTSRKEDLESFIVGRGLRVENVAGEPSTFSTINGASNIDVTLTSGGLRLGDWRVIPEASSSDHQLITFSIHGRATGTPTNVSDQRSAFCRFRERGVDWDRFQRIIHYRVGLIDWKKPASQVCKEFTNVVTRTATECLGTTAEGKRNRGYEWWTPRLDSMRKKNNRLRKSWQSFRKRGVEAMEVIPR